MLNNATRSSGRSARWHVEDPQAPLAWKTLKGFSLVELLVVISMMVVMTSFSRPMITSIFGANSVNQAISDLSGTLEQARAYAMANHTYVCVGFGSVPSSPSRPVPSYVVLSLYSMDGTRNAFTATDLASNTKWAAINRPLVLQNFVTPSTSLGAATDATPDTTDVPPFTRNLGNLGAVQFNGCIQFSPGGAAQVRQSTPARFIKVALDQSAPRDGKNPFAIRLGGLTGSITILRKENL